MCIVEKGIYSHIVKSQIYLIMSKDYLPSSDSSTAAWLLNFKTKIGTLGASLGLLPADVTAIQAQCTSWITSINAVETKRGELAAALQARDAAEQASGTDVRERVRRMKTNAGYTDAIGEELKIIASGVALNRGEFKATISAERFAGFVRIKFVKKNTEGINLYHRKKGDSVWKFLARDTKSPYDDHIELAVAGQPEHWEYRAFAVVDDEEIGQASDIVEVVYGG